MIFVGITQIQQSYPPINQKQGVQQNPRLSQTKAKTEIWLADQIDL